MLAHRGIIQEDGLFSEILSAKRFFHMTSGSSFEMLDEKLPFQLREIFNWNV